MRMVSGLLAFCVAFPLAAEPVDCLIEAKSIVELVASEEGTISDVPARRGDRVQKGDLLVQLDDTMEQLQLELSRVRAASDIDLRAQGARLALRQKEYDRAVTLVERSVTSGTVLEDAEIELFLTQFALEQAQLDQALAEIEMAQAEAMVSRKRILSPVDGIVLEVEGAPGEYATEQKVILTVAEIDPLHVEVFAPASLFGKITEGSEYQVDLEAPLSGQFAAEAVIVDRVLDSASSTFGIRLEIPNPDGLIPAGARCTVNFAIN